MENNEENRKALFEDIEPCGGGYSVIDGQKVHIDELEETAATGTTESGDWFAAKRDFGIIKFAETIARADQKIYTEEQKIRIEKRKQDFLDTHDNETLYTIEHYSSWFRRLTGACLSGRNEFAAQHGLDMQDKCNAAKFFEIVVSGGVANDTLKELQEHYDGVELLYEKAGENEATNPDSTV